MTLSELIVSILKKVSMDDQTGLSADTIDNYKDNPEYKEYANNVIGTINMAISNLVANERVPYKSLKITISSSISELTKADYPELDSAYRIKLMYYKDTEGVANTITFVDVGDIYDLLEEYTSGTIVILYAPIIAPIAEEYTGSLVMETLGLNHLCLQYIINFAKAELYEKIEPEMALTWRSIATSYLASLSQEVNMPTQRKVRQVVKLGR